MVLFKSMRLVFATRNQGKVKEMRAMLAGLDVEVVSQEEAGMMEEVVEDSQTFEENALKKARFVAKQTGQWAVADDSGICIDALGGAPGIQSARWAGNGAEDEAMIQFTLTQLERVPDANRPARFESAVALVSPDGQERVFYGTVNGQVAREPRGIPRSKLPYDMIFIPQGHTRTFAEMSDAEKNSLSHRGSAFVKLRGFLKTRV